MYWGTLEYCSVCGADDRLMPPVGGGPRASYRPQMSSGWLFLDRVAC
jgi:hypothetical protein